MKFQNWRSISCEFYTMSSTTGRKRVTERHYSAEEQALDQISKEAEARIQARRAARAEAREIRLREIAKQQKEDEERLKTQEADSGKSLSSYSGSRRGSDESASTDTDVWDKDPKDAVRQLKSTLRDLEEKYKKAMSTNAQLDNQKHTLVYQVELLKDQLEEQEESMIEVQREYKDKCREYENHKRSFNDLEFQYNSLKQQMSYRDRLLQESGFTVVSTDEGQLKLEKCSNMTNGPVMLQGSLLISDEAAEMLAKAGEGSLGISDKNGSLSVLSDLHFNSHSHAAGTMDYKITILDKGSHENEKDNSRETMDKTQVAELNKVEFNDHNEVHTFKGYSTIAVHQIQVSEMGNIVSGRNGFEKNDNRDINDGIGKLNEEIKEVIKEEESMGEEVEQMDEDEKDGRKGEEKMEKNTSEQNENETVKKFKDEVLVDDEVFEECLEEFSECKDMAQKSRGSITDKEAIICEKEKDLDEQSVFSSVSSDVVTFKDGDENSKVFEVVVQTDGSTESCQVIKETKELIDQEQVVGNGKTTEMDVIEATVTGMVYKTEVADKDDETSGGGCEVIVVAEVDEMFDKEHKHEVIDQTNSIKDDQANEEKHEDIVVCRKQKEMVDASEQDVYVQGQVDKIFGQVQETTVGKDGQLIVDQTLEVFGQEEKVLDNGQDITSQGKKDEVVGHRQENIVINYKQENADDGQEGNEVSLHNDHQDVVDLRAEDRVVSQDQFPCLKQEEDLDSSGEVSQEEVFGKEFNSGRSMEECAKELVNSVIGKAVLISQLDRKEIDKTVEENDAQTDAGYNEKDNMLCAEDMSNRCTKSEKSIDTAEDHSLSCDIVKSVTLCEPEIIPSITEEDERSGQIDNPAPKWENIDSSLNKDIAFTSAAVDRSQRDIESEESSALSVSDNEASVQSLSEETSSQRDSTAISEALDIESQINSNKEPAAVAMLENESMTSGGLERSKKEVVASIDDHESLKVKAEGSKGSKSHSESQEKKTNPKEMKNRKSKKKSKEEGGLGKEKQDDKDCSIS